MSNFQPSTLIILGTLAEDPHNAVFKGQDSQTGELFALKTIKLNEDGTFPPPIRREVQNLQKLRHRNIITLHNIVHTKPNPPMLVLEYMDYDLNRFIGNSSWLDYLTLKSLIYQISEGLAYCHKNQIVHRNVNPSSIFINYRGHLKLSGFSRARDLTVPATNTNANTTNLCFGHPWYRAPELILGDQDYGTAIDIWSVGCLMFELYMRRPLFSSDDELVHLEKIFTLLGTPTPSSWPGISLYTDRPQFNDLLHSSIPPRDLRTVVPGIDQDALDLFSGLLQLTPGNRIGADVVVTHPWFNGLADQMKKRMEAHLRLHYGEISRAQCQAEGADSELCEGL